MTPPVAPPAAPPAPPPEVAGFRLIGRSTAGLAEYVHEATGIEMVLLPGGDASIGSSLDEVERVSTQINAVASDPRIATLWKQNVRAEGPPHHASLRPFLIAREEVSQAVWTKTMGSNPSRVRRDDFPVEGVSWDDAKAFCKKTGLALPTEAQWEYACRAGASPSAEAQSPSSKSVLPVTAAQANAFGLRGMLGNVWEWCEDAYDDRFYARMDASGLEPLCSTESPLAARVLRGGAWASPPWTRRPAARESAPPSKGRELRGFRVMKRL